MSDVTKVAVVDSRILQPKPKFAVEKGPLSLTNVPYRAITATSSQMTFNIIVPSESVFVDRAVDWSATVYGSVDVTMTAAGSAKVPIAVYGRDCALAPFPLHQMCSTMSATINDTTTVVNTNDVLNQLLRLADYKKHRKLRTCPNMLDRYYTYPQTNTASALTVGAAFNTGTLSQLLGQGFAQGVITNSPLCSFQNEQAVDEKPNGSWGDFTWCDSDGSVPAGTFGTPVAVTTTASGTTAYNFINGVPVYPASPGASDVYRLYFRFKSTERLVISPFIWADDYEISTGLFGIQNIQLLMNFQNPLAGGRLLRFANNFGQFGNQTAGTSSAVGTAAAATVGNQQFQNLSSGTPFASTAVNIQYLTPSLDVPLPAKNIVPYMDYPRYISQQSTGSIPATTLTGNTSGSQSSTSLNSQTITLPAIPDLLVIYVKPNTYPTTVGGATPDPTQGDWVLPVTGISVNFDNFAGLLSSHTQEELYRMSVRNGLEMDFDQWRGYATEAYGQGHGGSAGSGNGAPLVPLSGGPLILKPGRDIVLQAGQAPSLVGNFVFQFTLNVQNQTGAAQTACSIYVIAINSGYLETIKGSSRIIKGVLTEQDILSAPMGPGSAQAGKDGLDRMEGAGRLAESSHSASRHGRHGRRSSSGISKYM
jgi:hypothetical protein